MADKKKSPARETVKELRELSVEELSTKLATAQLEKTSELKAMKQQVARISTILNEKEQRG